MLPIIAKREIMHLGADYRTAEECFRWSDHKFFAVEEDVSLWSGAQHLFHLSLVNDQIFRNILKLFEDADDSIVRRGRPSFRAYVLFATGKIPRGRVKTPKPYDAPPEVDRDEVHRRLTATKKQLAEVAPRAKYLAQARGKVLHPVLGPLKALQWLKFCRIHMDHHLKIVDEISRSYDRRRSG